jgi:hypothetical protein
MASEGKKLVLWKIDPTHSEYALKTKFLSFSENEITSGELGVGYIDIEISNDEFIVMSPEIWDALKLDDVEQGIDCQTWTRYGDFCVTFTDDGWSFDGENAVPLKKPVKTCLDNKIYTGRGVFNNCDLKMAKEDRGYQYITMGNVWKRSTALVFYRGGKTDQHPLGIPLIGIYARGWLSLGVDWV